MPLIDANYSAGTGVRYTLVAGDDLRIARGTAVWSSDQSGVVSTAGGHNITVDGALFGVRLGVGITGNGNTVTIGKTGYILSEVHSRTDAFVSAAISLVGYTQTIVNQGQVAGRIGILLNLTPGFAPTETSNIQNDGRIFGHDTGVWIQQASVQTTLFDNNGVLAGRTAAFNASEALGNIFLTNDGLVKGNIWLGQGNDIYDGFNGRVISFTASVAQILGGAGDDTFRPGASAEFFGGGSGIDTVDYSRSSAIKVSLANNFIGTGAAKGDGFIGIEQLFGSLKGADYLQGTFGNETFWGNGGRDTISASVGNDVLYGGSGLDLLTGGTGDDAFVFEVLSDTGDKITDFSSGGTNGDDEIWIGIAFGGGLQEGALDPTKFRISTTNRAGDSDDRFIFRTTDKTLWFDPDGRGGAGARLVADLQQSASLTAADIQIVILI